MQGGSHRPRHRPRARKPPPWNKVSVGVDSPKWLRPCIVTTLWAASSERGKHYGMEPSY